MKCSTRLAVAAIVAYAGIVGAAKSVRGAEWTVVSEEWYLVQPAVEPFGLADADSQGVMNLRLRLEPPSPARTDGPAILVPDQSGLQLPDFGSDRMVLECDPIRALQHRNMISNQSDFAVPQRCDSPSDVIDSSVETGSISTVDYVLLKDAGAVSGEWFQPGASK